MKASVPPFGLRMEAGLKARVSAAAAANRRSMNSEIVYQLEKALEPQQETGAAGSAIPPRHDHANPVEGNGNEYAD